MSKVQKSSKKPTVPDPEVNFYIEEDDDGGDRQYRIDKGIQAPPHGKVTALSAVIDKMEVGDSIIAKDNQEAIKIAAMLYYRGFKTRRRKEAGGIRVWKVPRLEGN